MKQEQGEQDAIRTRNRFNLGGLDLQRQQAIQRATEEANCARARYSAEYASLTEALSKLASQLKEDLREIDQRAGEQRSKLFHVTWQEAKAKNRLKAFAAIRFSRYVRRIFFLVQ